MEGKAEMEWLMILVMNEHCSWISCCHVECKLGIMLLKNWDFCSLYVRLLVQLNLPLPLFLNCLLAKTNSLTALRIAMALTYP